MSQSQLKHFRQGDILVRGIPNLPKRLKRLKATDRYILAEGEATGHCHSLEAVEGLTIYQQEDNGLFLKIGSEAAELKHQEHGTITLPLGNYEVVRQREYNPKKNYHVFD
ncbi:MAG: hypothetical protein ACSHX4_10930 [Opitutaceae bacterium]